MNNLSFIEKQIICRLFGIADGFVFKYWSDRGIYNKSKTKELIFEACGINIFEDKEYSGLSQQKCIQKIWDECSPQTISKLLETLSDYFCFQMGTDMWSDEDRYDYSEVQKIIEKLKSVSTVELPKEENIKNLKLLLEDIESNVKNGKPELVVDRLHTFASQYLRNLCYSHNIGTVDDKGNEYPIHSLVGMLRKWYMDNGYFDSEFAAVAIQNSINIFDKFNGIRNDNSAAHPNHLLSKAEAEYAVKIIANTLTFIDKCEKSKSQKVQTLPWDGGILYVSQDEELPF